ncbi:MAG TPA: DoxX family protein [Nitrospira sp.]|nr:DoxX family protein [Nitrospira sp.]
MIGSPYVVLIGRVLLGLIFLLSGISKIADAEHTQQYMIAMGMTWMTTLLYLGAIVIELAGSLSLLLGYHARIGAWLLFLFMIPTTLIFHTHLSDQNQMIHFLKNLSIMGGLLYVATYGAGRLSMDAGLDRAERTAEPRTQVFKKVMHQ